MLFTRGTDLSARLIDRPGAVVSMLNRLAQAKVHIQGYATIGGTLHVLAAIPEDMSSQLRNDLTQQDVVIIDAPDEPGLVAHVLQAVADAALNITCLYLASDGRVVVGAPDVDRLATILSECLS